jgi:hypothetical protein
MEALNSVYLGAPALYCAAGSGTDALWQAMLTGGPRPQSLDVASNAWPQHCAFLVDEPDLRPYGIDRKVLRTMEKQARLNRVQFETGGLGPWLGAGRTHMAAFPEGGSVKTGVTR